METEDPTAQEGAAPAGTSAIRAMTRASQEHRAARVMSLAKALRLTAARVADEQLDLAVAVIGTRIRKIAGDALAAHFDPGALMILLDGPVCRRGAALLDADLVNALIQQQTMGKVGKPLGERMRKMTDTDAAICEPFLNTLIKQAAPLPEEAGEKALMDRFAFGARVADQRLLLMALDAAEYEVITLTLDLAGGTRQGILQLCFPHVAPAGSQESGGSEGTPDPATPPPFGLDRQVLALNAELRIAIDRMSMPLAQVRDLKPGDVLELGGKAFDHALVQTRDGRRLGHGTLGQINGFRALQLEHEEQGLREPRRRAADRAELDLPRVDEGKTGAQPSQEAKGRPRPEKKGEDTEEDETSAQDQTKNDALPDMSDLPGFEEQETLGLKTG